MEVTHTDEGPVIVVNRTPKDIIIAGIVVPANGSNDNFPIGLLPAVKAHPNLSIEGDPPPQSNLPTEKSHSLIVPVKYGVEPEVGISVVIPTFNRTDLLKRACDSVLLSSFTNYELIVVDDGSAVNVLDTIRQIAIDCKDKRVPFLYIYSSVNQGIAATRNMGAQLSKFDAILMTDSDDEILPETLMMFSETFESTGADVIYGNIKTVKDDTGESTYGQAPEWAKGKLQKVGCYILGPRLISRKAWLSVCGCDDNFILAEDLDILIRIEVAGGAFIKIDQVLGIVHDHKDRVTKSPETVQTLGLSAMQARGQMGKRK